VSLTLESCGLGDAEVATVTVQNGAANKVVRKSAKRYLAWLIARANGNHTLKKVIRREGRSVGVKAAQY